MAGSAFFTAASGLRNHQTRIDVIANNIANVNTHGYKGSSMIFADVLSQTLRGASAPSGNFGGINPKQVGLGMQIAAIHTLMSQAALESTSRQTDFAVSGAGFFVLSNGNEEIYTRAGDFSVDKDGRLVANNGYRIQGYNQLTADGSAIDPGSRIGDITIQFGKKLEARQSTWLTYQSNLDSSSNRYGSANNDSANIGTTGILTFAGAAEPWTTAVGTNPVTAGAGSVDVSINGLPAISVAFAAAATPADQATVIADAININPGLSPYVQATVRQSGGNNYVVLQAVRQGTFFSVQDTGAGETGFPTAAAQTYTPPTEPGAFLAGMNTITVTDAKAATMTSGVPVGTGANRPQTGDRVFINGISVKLDQTYDVDATAAENAAKLAADINDADPNLAVTATANPNGTVSFTHKYAGQQRQPLDAGPVPPAPPAGFQDYDIVIQVDDATVPAPPNYPDQAGLAGRWGLTSLPNWNTVVGGNDFCGIDNGVNAKAELLFTPDDNSAPITRFVEDWSYDRSIPANPLATFTNTNSSLGNVQNAIAGAGATFPLMPGVVVSIDALAAGQANFRTETAFEHTTSQVVYDSLGNSHNLTTKFTHVKQNEWQYDISLPEEPDIQLSNTTGRITFSDQGLITSGNPLVNVTFTAPGASPSSVQLIFDGQGKPISGITQYASDTTTAARDQDGYAMGVLNDFEADQTGTIIGFYSNGQRRPVAQLSLATFTNPEGLERAGDTAFQETTNSGKAVHLRPGTGGSGVIFNGYLEQSNVDLALEFTNLIMTQRGLQANSRVFTTQDEVLQEVVNLKR
jgi:flagellar hook-basal body protein